MHFCHDDFWDYNLTWHSDIPKFTECFQDLVLLLPSGIFVILAVPWTLVHYSRSKNVLLKTETCFSGLFLTKLTFIIFLLILSVMEATWKLMRPKNDVTISFFICFGTKISVFILAICLTFYEESQRIWSSLVFTAFWPLLFISTLPSLIMTFHNMENVDCLQVFINASSASLIGLLIIANFFSDLSGIDPEGIKHLSPKTTSSFTSSLFLGWFEPIVIKGFKTPLTQKDLPPVPDSVNAKENISVFQNHWKQHIKDAKVDFSNSGAIRILKLWKPLFSSFGLRFVFGLFCGLICFVEDFASPLILKLLIKHIENQDEEIWKGYLYVLLLFIASVFYTMMHSHYIVLIRETATRFRSALISAICRKALRLSSTARRTFTSGQITNLVSVDTQRIADGMAFVGNLWRSPIQISIGICLIYKELGYAALIGSIGVGLLIPLNFVGGKILEKLETKQLLAKDSRIKLMNDVLNGIKVLKLYAWETPFMKRVEDIRQKEIGFLKANAWIFGVVNFNFCISPFLITIGSFSSFVLLDPKHHILTPEKAFVCISLFNKLRFPLTMFPMTFKTFVDMKVSFKRITAFLNADEICFNNDNGNPQESNAIEIVDSSFSWNQKEDPTLNNVNFQVEKGNFVAIVGSVGSGKSSLLQAILGEIKQISGNVKTSGKFSYVSQQAWIQNLSLKDNILFNKPYSEKKYQDILKACSLEQDLSLLTNGDETEIGENGINLSGGQRQRVALARAIYFGGDIFILDDPLSAVDAHVGNYIFENVLNSSDGILKDTTRILVTNEVSFLPQVDQIVFMKNGSVLDQGTFEDLKATNRAFADFIRQTETTQGFQEEKSFAKMDSNTSEKGNNIDGKIIKEEKSFIGNVPFHVFKDFISKIGLIITILFFLGNVIEQSLHACGVLWLSKWSDDSRLNASRANEQATFRLGVYSGICISNAFLVFFRDIAFYLNCALAAKLIHTSLLNGVIKSPMSFFDINPIGRIINRFSADIDSVDVTIPSQAVNFVKSFCEILATFALISYGTPIFMAAIIPIVIVFFAFQRLYIVTSRQIKRLYSVSKSPIFSYFSEIVKGAPTIRAFQVEDIFLKELESRIHENVKSYYLTFISNRWLSMRIENIANVMIFLTALFCVIKRESLQPGLAALSITYALNIFGSVVNMIRAACDLENNSVALERIFEFSNLEPEAQWTSNSEIKDSSWPHQGKIEFKDLSVYYRKGLDPVLKGINLQILPKEKVGFCGRTGAGKSSLALSLYRIIEPLEGQITIDDIDIGQLGLHELRTKLSIIPQEPVLFTGSLRFNLDPVGKYPDGDLWKVLEQSHLKNYVLKNLENGLDVEVDENGGNFSIGQRQLICLARALLRKSKILIMDEATASVDMETDELIQATIRQEFEDCTILTIAHRLNTILDSDKVVVLDQGQIIEVGNPEHLLKNP